MTLQEVKDYIYDHINQENDMELPVHESWEGIMEGVDWVDECLENGYTLEQLQGEIFEEVLEQWEKDNQ